MGYYEFNIKTSDESKDAVIQNMMTIGCLGLIETDSHIVAYFPDVLGIDSIREGLASFRQRLRDSGLDDNLSYGYVFIGERDWNESWKSKFKPIDIGENLSILPPWEENNNGRINLIIDPAMAFGTGHHETTQSCLMFIEKFSKCTAQKSFLDFGAGTGILSIAALKLGFKHAVCVDIDPLAIDAAQKNAVSNNLNNISIINGSIAEVQGAFDFIAANIMSDILIQNAGEIASKLNKSGIALLSGMIVGQEIDVIEAMQREDLVVIEKLYDGRWVSVLVRPAVSIETERL